jgi:hypothetical protein
VPWNQGDSEGAAFARCGTVLAACWLGNDEASRPGETMCQSCDELLAPGANQPRMSPPRLLLTSNMG